MIKYSGPQGPWIAEFAYIPRKDIHGTWHWLSTIYRREKNRIIYPHQGYEYGTSVDYIIEKLVD
jgi:hypothetical protein